jgi:membrane-associated phospholipid phosphatase
MTGVAGVLANTQLDENFQNWFQDSLVGDGDPDYAHWAHVLGEPWLFPAGAALLWGVTEYIDANPLTRGRRVNTLLRNWSRQTTRAYLVAAPAVYLQGWVLGGSRPGEADYGSRWQPFDDNNAVSAHAAIGAVPFLVAARYTDKWYWRTLLIVASGFAGYAQLYDNSNYLSQVLLGYSIAFLAVEATDATNQSGLGYRIVPLSATGLWGVGIEFRH